MRWRLAYHNLLQVAVSGSDMDFKWSISPQAPQPASAATEAATAAYTAADSSHYGILLAKMAGLPASVTDAALHIARHLDTQHAARQQQQEGDGKEDRLRQVRRLLKCTQQIRQSVRQLSGTVLCRPLLVLLLSRSTFNVVRVCCCCAAAGGCDAGVLPGSQAGVCGSWGSQSRAADSRCSRAAGSV